MNKTNADAVDMLTELKGLVAGCRKCRNRNRSSIHSFI